FSLSSIITFFLQLMGITWERIRGLLARHIGEENIALIEQAYELIANLIAMGPQGIFEMIKEQLNPQNILDMVLQAAVDFFIETLIRQVSFRVLALFNPVGAIVQAIEAIYRVLKWIFENVARIFSLVETIVNGMADIIAGNISGMANAVEEALARLLAPVIDFFAGFLGLGNLPDRIADTIRGFQELVESILERVIAWLAERARALLRSLGLGGAEEEPEGMENVDPEVAAQITAGLAEVPQKESRFAQNGKITREEANQVAEEIRREHRIFQQFEVIDRGTNWGYRYSPGNQEISGSAKDNTIQDGEAREGFSMSGESHTIQISIDNGNLEITMSSALRYVIPPALEKALSEVRDMPNFMGKRTIRQRLEHANNLVSDDYIYNLWTRWENEQREPWPRYLNRHLLTVVSDLSNLIVGEIEIKNLVDLGNKLKRNTTNPGRYAHLTDPPDVAPYLPFSDTQRTIILDANKSQPQNGGLIRSDLSNTVLDDTLPMEDPLKPNIDHIIRREDGGSNSYSNAQVLSREENLAKH
ncbi:MAG: hypothetical protein AB4372_02795, partial [Xenococcus sp. (in: cyanobacteria)]